MYTENLFFLDYFMKLIPYINILQVCLESLEDTDFTSEIS